MTIPVTAGSYTYVPASLSEVEGAPEFVLRHGTRKDKHDLQFEMQAAGLVAYSEDQIRKAIIDELRSPAWESEDRERGITQIEAYWEAIDEFRERLMLWNDQCKEVLAEADEGDKPKLPDTPRLDFDEDMREAIEQQLAEVQAHSRRVAHMSAMNTRFTTTYPRIILRMLLKSTTLDVKMSRAAGVLTEDCCEDVLEALDAFAVKHGDEQRAAVFELLGEAQAAFRLSEGEEKNSSSPASGRSARKRSAKSSTSQAAKRSGRKKTSAKAPSPASSG